MLVSCDSCQSILDSRHVKGAELLSLSKQIKEFKQQLATAHRLGSDNRIYAVIYNDGKVDSWSTDQGAPSMPYICEWDIEQQLAQARREGWEQGKKQTDSLLLDLVDVVLESKPVVQSARRAIAAMEYKEDA